MSPEQPCNDLLHNTCYDHSIRPKVYSDCGELHNGAEECRKRLYSIRSALIGEMEAARTAGINAANEEQIASAVADIDRERGSQDEMP